MLSLTQMISRSAQINPNGIATAMDGRETTWQQLAENVSSVAGGLQKLGVQKEDRVAILALNSDAYYECLFAIPWAGAVSVPVNSRLADPEIEYWLENSESKVLFVDQTFADRIPALQAKLPKLEHVVYISQGDAPHNFKSYADLLDSDGVEDARRANDDIAAIYYTGGTTGRSKGVMLSHSNLVSNTMQVSSFLGLKDNERILHVAPMFHIAEGVMINSSAMVAGSNHFMPAFDPEGVMKAIQEHKIQRLMMVPTMINMMVNHPAISNYDMSSLEAVLYGASPIPEAVITKAIEVLPHTRFQQGYGQTEAAPFISGLPHEYHVSSGPLSGKLSSAGRAVPGVELAILDEDDQPLAVGEVGEICLRGPNVMKGYLDMEEVTQTTLRNGWLHTGDGGRLDEDGFLFIVDRVKDMIVSGGENVYSIEVENAVHKHPDVAQCAVIGVPHETWGEQVHAIVVPKPGAEPASEDIINFCRGLIADYKCPRTVSFQKDPLPLSGAGKILKNELRKTYWDGNDRAVN